MQVAPPVVSGVSQGLHLGLVLGQLVLGQLGLGPLPINLHTTIILHPTLPTPQALTIPPMTTYLKVSN